MGLMEIHWRITISGNGADVVSHRTCGASTGHCMWIYMYMYMYVHVHVWYACTVVHEETYMCIQCTYSVGRVTGVVVVV